MSLSPAQLAVANLAVETLHVLLTEDLAPFQQRALEKVLETLRNLASPDLQNLTPEEHDLMVSGKKILAIKSVRDRTNAGLKEAKDLVEKFYPSSYVPRATPSLSNLSRVEYETQPEYPSSWREGCGDPERCP